MRSGIGCADADGFVAVLRFRGRDKSRKVDVTAVACKLLP